MPATLSRADYALSPVVANLDSTRDENKFHPYQRRSNGHVVPALAAAIVDEGLGAEFPELVEEDLLLRVYLHWQDIVSQGAISVLPRQVVLDFGARFASTENSRFHFRLRARLSKNWE